MRKGWVDNVLLAIVSLLWLSCAPQVVHPPVTEPLPDLADSVPEAPTATVVQEELPSEEVSETTAEAPSGPLRLREVRLGEEDGRRLITFRLSRPPDAVNYFSLRSPTRVVIDLLGAVEVSPRVEKFSAVDDLLSRVRVGSHDGRMRLVLDLAAEEVPPFAISEQDSVVTARVGEKGEGQIIGQMLFVAEVAAVGEEEEAIPVIAEEPATAAAPAVASGQEEAPSAVEAETKETTTAAVSEGEVIGEEPAAVYAPGQEEVASAVETQTRETPKEKEPEEAETADVPVVDPPPGQEETPSAAEAETRETTAQETTTEEEFVDPDGAGQYTGQRISLDFKDADIHNVLRILADVSGLNIIATDDVKGRITLRLMDIPWDQALDLILKANRLEAVREGNVVRISTVERLKEEREARLAAEEAAKELAPLRVKYITVNYAKADGELVKKVKGVLTERGSADFDGRTNTIIVRDIENGIAAAQELVKQLDTQAPQVLIEANIVEVQETFLQDLGIQWGYRFIASPETGNPTGVDFPGRLGFGGSGLGTGFGGPTGPVQFDPSTGKIVSPPTFFGVPFIADFPANVAPGSGSAFDLALGSLSGSKTLNARITALENRGRAKVISRPRVTTINNTPATIESLRIIRVRLPSTGTVISTGAGGVAGTSTTATEQIRTGISLAVSPQVSADGFILLGIRAKSSTVAPSSTGEAIPDEISREATSNVLIKNAETVVLGGIFRDELSREEAGVPYLRNIPVLGWLFKGKTIGPNTRFELLVFITPSIVNVTQVASLPTAGQLWQERKSP